MKTSKKTETKSFVEELKPYKKIIKLKKIKIIFVEELEFYNA